MNEELDSQLSAMFDDELPAPECELLARRLARDEVMKSRWGRYAAIGAAIRSESSLRLDTKLANRVSAAIAAEPPLVADPVVSGGDFATSKVRRWLQPVAGVALAASVAAVAILGLRALSPLEQSPIVAQNSEPTEQAASDQIIGAEPDSYVVPTTIDRPSIVAPAALANYVVAHSEYSTPLVRRNLLSALVAGESGNAGASGQSEESTENGMQDAEQAK